MVVVSFSDWWQSLIDRAEPAPKPAPTQSSQRISQPNRWAGASVTKKTFHSGTSNTAAPANDYRAQTRNLYREGLGMTGGQARTSQPRPAPTKAKPNYGAQTRDLYREGLGINPTPGPPREPRPDYGAQTRDLYREGLGLERTAAREPQRNDKGEVWDRDDLAELDAKTSARVDQEFAAEGRKQTLATERPLTDAEYAALSPRQQAAILFNTGLIDAGRADEAAGGGIDATKEYLSRFGIAPKGDDLTSFLRLDDLISDSILQKLDDLTTRQQSADTARWARGDEKAAGEAGRFNRARNTSDQAAEAIAQLLTTTGNRTFGATDTRAGFGTALRDEVVKQAYAYMIDSRFDYKPQEIAENLQVMNQQAGTDVSTDELWDYLRANVDAVDFHRAGNNAANLPHPTESPYDQAPLTPLDVAEIRRRYGL